MLILFGFIAYRTLVKTTASTTGIDNKNTNNNFWDTTYLVLALPLDPLHRINTTLSTLSIRLFELSHPIVDTLVQRLAQTLLVAKGVQHGPHVRVVRMGDHEIRHVVAVPQRAGAVNVRKSHRAGGFDVTVLEFPIDRRVHFVNVPLLAAHRRHAGVSRDFGLGNGEDRVGSG